jgi:hypothetical protein
VDTRIQAQLKGTPYQQDKRKRKHVEEQTLLTEVLKL